MKIAAVLNEDSGTLRTARVDEYCQFLDQLCASHGHQAEISPVHGDQLAETLEKVFNTRNTDAVFVAGGDGTISAAARLAWKAQIPLGVIPAGTMNLFARSLKIPLEIEDAARALVAGQAFSVDIATANGRPFLLQYTAGFHPQMVHQRNEAQFNSRLGKIRATIFAALDAIRRPPSFAVEVMLDGKTREMTLSSIAVSNNPYGEGHLPYADDLTGGTLAIYLARPADTATNAKMLADLTLGTWRANPDIQEMQAKEVRLRFPSRHKRAKASVDGELVTLEGAVEFSIHPAALPVILPGQLPEQVL